MKEKIYLSVVIPAYNEEENFNRGSLRVVLDYLKEKKYSWELVLVNDGSTDITLELLNKFAVESPNIRVINNHHMGKAATVVTGALSAKGKVILFSDMDQATPISEFDKFEKLFAEGYDIVIGSRSGRQNAPIFRKILAYGMVLVRSIILNLPFKDTQCGFKAFTKESADKIFNIMTKNHPLVEIVGPAVNAGFDVELLYLGKKFNYKIGEVMVSWRHQETRRVSFVKDAISSLKELILIRWRIFNNKYE